MTEELKKRKVSLLTSPALELLDTSERKEQTIQLLNELLPDLVADIENNLYEQETTVFYEIFLDKNQPKIRVILKLKKLEHEFLIHLDSKRAMFVIGSERSGEHTSTLQHKLVTVHQIQIDLQVASAP